MKVSFSIVSAAFCGPFGSLMAHKKFQSPSSFLSIRASHLYFDQNANILVHTQFRLSLQVQGVILFHFFFDLHAAIISRVLRDVTRLKMMKKEFFNASFPIASLFQLGTEVQIGQIAFLAITRPKIILQCAFWAFICSFVTLDISYFMVHRQKMTPSHQNLRFC